MVQSCSSSYSCYFSFLVDHDHLCSGDDPVVGLHGGLHRRLLHSDVLHPLRLRVAWREGHDALLRQELRQVSRHLHPARPRHQLRESIIIVIISSIVVISIFTRFLGCIHHLLNHTNV